MDDLNFFNSTSFFNILGAWSIVIGVILYSISAPDAMFIKEKDSPDGIFYIKDRDNPHGRLIQIKYDFIIWPAIVAQLFFDTFWGKVGKGWLGVLTWRSFFMTLTFSVVINFVCILMIIGNIPSDVPNFSTIQISILIKSELMFILCNFIGDLFSVNVTRFLINKLINAKIKKWKFIIYDLIGIFFGYFLMAMPGLLVLLVSESSSSSDHKYSNWRFFTDFLTIYVFDIMIVKGIKEKKQNE